MAEWWQDEGYQRNLAASNTSTQQSSSPPANSGVTPTNQPSNPTVVDSQAQQSAKALITSTLAIYGLEALADRAWQMYLNGLPIEQIMLDLRQTDEYKARFPGMAALSAKGQAISEREYIDIERAYTSMFRAAGLPPGLWDSPDDFGQFIGNNVSPQEMQERLDLAVEAAYRTPPEVRAEMARLYNTTIGDITAFVLDVNKALPIVQRQFAASERSAAALRAGYGTLTRDEAERFADSNMTFEQMQQAFAELVNSRELFNPIAVGEDTITRNDQLDALSGNANAIRRIDQQRRRRQAVFDEGGSYARGGFGTANT